MGDCGYIYYYLTVAKFLNYSTLILHWTHKHTVGMKGMEKYFSSQKRGTCSRPRLISCTWEPPADLLTIAIVQNKHSMIVVACAVASWWCVPSK
jgi:hypothetical protein